MLATTLVGAALASLLFAGAYNYAQARGLLTGVAESQLRGQQAGAVRSLRNGLDLIQDQTAIIARDPSTADALERFSAARDALDSETALLSASQSNAVDAFYREWSDTIDGPSAAELAPVDPTTRYLQHEYVVTNDLPDDRRAELVTAPGDDSPYGTAHEQLHPELALLAATAGFADLLLIDTDGTVVYTAAKRPDFATDLVNGPYRDTALGATVTTRLAQAGVDRPVLVDPEPYPPARDRPVMFAAAIVADGAEVVGAVAVEIPTDAINALTTNEQRWRESGLGDTGEVYVVGADRRLRSDARLWLEEPDAYLDALDRAGFPAQVQAAIVDAESTIGLQPAETDAVDAAFDGRRTVARGGNYLGEPTLSVAGPLGSSAVDWVVVAELAIAEGAAPLAALELRLLLTAAIVIPLVAAAGLLLADRISRPLVPVVAGAADVARGELDAPIADQGPTEVGDVGRRLDQLAADLRSARVAQEQEEHEVSQLLRSVLPARVAEQLKADDAVVDDLIDTATVIALTVEGGVADGLTDDEAVELTARLSRELESAADDIGLERIRSASDHHLFAAGLGSPDVDADRAAQFVLAVEQVIEGIESDADVELRHRGGLAAGTVVSGLLHPDTLTYRVFGQPVRDALTLAAVAADGQVLVEPTVAQRLDDAWQLRTAPDLTDLRGDPVEASLLLTPR